MAAAGFTAMDAPWPMASATRNTGPIMDILSRVFPVESAHMATLHAQSKKLSDLWALGALLVRLPVRAVGIPPLTGVTARVGTEILTHSRDTDEFR